MGFTRSQRGRRGLAVRVIQLSLWIALLLVGAPDVALATASPAAMRAHGYDAAVHVYDPAASNALDAYSADATTTLHRLGIMLRRSSRTIGLAAEEEQLGLTQAAAERIQQIADRTGQTITVVGSRAGGTATSSSDFDYILSGPSRARGEAARLLPRGGGGGQVGGTGETGIDIFQDYNPKAPGYSPLDPSLPHITFSPTGSA